MPGVNSEEQMQKLCVMETIVTQIGIEFVSFDGFSSLAFYLNYQTRLDSASRFLGRLSWVDGRGM